MTKRNIRRYLGLYLLGLALLLRFIFGASPWLLDMLWMQVWFPLVRWLQSSLRFFWILPGYYLGIMALLLWLWWRFPRKWLEVNAWAVFGRRLLNLLGGVGASFLMLWGYNYLEPGVGQRMGLERGTDRELLADAYLEVMEEALALRSQIRGIEQVDNIEALPYKQNSAQIASWVKEVLEPLGYPTRGDVRLRHIWPKGALHRLNISGIYNPWTGEANVEGNLGPLNTTFTAAHEFAHAFGVTSEAEANFVAYLACARSDDALARYAAAYTLWRALGREVTKAYSEDEVKALAAHIPEQLLRDREAIRQRHLKHTAYFPKASTAMNDTYLKTQGVKAGVADYNAFVELYFALRDGNKAP